MASESRSNVPASTSSWASASYSSAEPSHQWTDVGLGERGHLLHPVEQLLVGGQGGRRLDRHGVYQPRSVSEWKPGTLSYPNEPGPSRLQGVGSSRSDPRGMAAARRGGSVAACLPPPAAAPPLAALATAAPRGARRAPSAAPTLALDRPCYTPGMRIGLSGAGYTPGGPLQARIALGNVDAQLHRPGRPGRRDRRRDPAAGVRRRRDRRDADRGDTGSVPPGQPPGPEQTAAAGVPRLAVGDDDPGLGRRATRPAPAGPAAPRACGRSARRHRVDHALRPLRPPRPAGEDHADRRADRPVRRPRRAVPPVPVQGQARRDVPRAVRHHARVAERRRRDRLPAGERRGRAARAGLLDVALGRRRARARAAGRARGA